MITSALMSLVLYYSSVYGIDPRLAEAVIVVESGGNVAAVGKAGEIGLMQLHPGTFPYSSTYLSKPENNIRLGIEYLSEVKKQCKHQGDFAYVVCFNMGVKRAERIRYPKSQRYYKRVMAAYQKTRGHYVEVAALQNGFKIGPRSCSCPAHQADYSGR